MTTTISSTNVNTLVITSFFICQGTKDIVEHVFATETESVISGEVITSWLPAFAENNGLDILDYVGGYAHIDGCMVAKENNFESCEEASHYFEEDVSKYITPPYCTVGSKGVAELLEMTASASNVCG